MDLWLLLYLTYALPTAIVLQSILKSLGYAPIPNSIIVRAFAYPLLAIVIAYVIWFGISLLYWGAIFFRSTRSGSHSGPRSWQGCAGRRNLQRVELVELIQLVELLQLRQQSLPRLLQPLL